MKNRDYRFVRIIGVLVLITLILASSGCGLPSSGARGEASLAAGNHNCRFWCIVSESAPTSVIQEQLVTDPNSLKNLSYSNDDGWSVGYYSDGSSEPIVNRGKSPAYSDPLFDTAVAEAAGATPRIAVSHVRNCSSGLCDIANPHPFERGKNGKYWLMGHNGTIDKTVLLSLIRPDYLAANPPAYGIDQSQWIDSELYFIFMLQTLEDYKWDIKPALGHVIQCLRDKIPGTGELLNFFLTDGTTLWGYRQGKSLYYFNNKSDTLYSVLASQYPSSSQGSWIAVSDGQLVTMNQGGVPVVENIENYFSSPSVTVTSPNGGQSWAAGTRHVITWSVTNLTGNVKIELLRWGSPVRTITSSTSAISGSYSWSITSSQSSGGDYRIKITSTSNSAVSDTSDANFTIVGLPPPSITVTSPNGGQSWATGTRHVITWNVANLTGNVKIELLKSGSTVRTITSSTSTSSGSYNWSIPTSQSSGSDYRISITSTSNSAVSDTSDANFTIVGH